MCVFRLMSYRTSLKGERERNDVGSNRLGG